MAKNKTTKTASKPKTATRRSTRIVHLQTVQSRIAKTRKIVKAKSNLTNVVPNPAKLPIRRSSRLKCNTATVEVGSSAYFGTGSSDLQRIFLERILKNNFNLLEQIQFRGVCHQWNSELYHIWKGKRTLVLTLKSVDWLEPNVSNQFRSRYYLCQQYNLYETHLTPLRRVGNSAHLTMGKHQWNSSTIDLIASLFCNIKHLYIISELPENDLYSNRLFKFLQKFTKILNFTLIMSAKCRNTFVTRLFGVINQYLAPLEALQLHLPCRHTKFKINNFQIQDYRKLFAYVQNLSFLPTVFDEQQLTALVRLLGKGRPSGFEVKSLGVSGVFNPRMRQMRPMLYRLRKLHITDLKDMNYLKYWSNHCHKLRLLHLRASKTEPQKFNIDYSKAVRSFTHINTLILDNFEFSEINESDIDHERLVKVPNILHLIITNETLFMDIFRAQTEYLSLDLLQPEDEQQIYMPFITNLALKLPNLMRLSIWAKMPTRPPGSQKSAQFKVQFANWCFTKFKRLKSVSMHYTRTNKFIF